MNKEDRERLADLVYETWRWGGNPDEVSGDEYDRLRSRGYEPEEISVRDVTPKRRRST
jgi:hypothetical protein